MITGPVRVFPGRLSVSRTFGDIEAKLPQFGGNKNVVIATPEVRKFKITSHTDFFLLGCDGIFDKMTNKECVEAVWHTYHHNRKKTIHEQIGQGVD